MEDLLNYNEEILLEYEGWKKNNDDENDVKVNIDQVSGNATAPIGVMYGKIQMENIHLAKDLQSNLGRSDTQHGEAGEKLEVRARNKAHILQGEEPSARTETNRLDQKVDIYDHGDAYQVKLCKTPEATLQNLLDKDYRGVKKIVPKEQYNQVMKLAQQKKNIYKNKAKECKNNGDVEGYKKYHDKAKKCEDILKTTEPSNVTRDMAIKASKNPTVTAMRFVAADAVEAGVKAGATAAVVSGVISGVTNVFEVMEGNKTFEEAIVEVSKTMGKSAVVGTVYGATTSAIQGTAGVLAKQVVKEGTAHTVLQGVANSNAVTYVLVATVEYTKSIKMYCDGKISKEEMLIRVGDTTVGMAGSIVGGVIGSAFCPPVGTIIGSTLGYLATSAFYHSVVEVVQTKKLADEYEKIIPLLKEAQDEMKKAREDFERTCAEYRIVRMENVKNAMNYMDEAINTDDMASFLSGLNTIVSYYGESLLYTDFNKFDSDMLDADVQIVF